MFRIHIVHHFILLVHFRCFNKNSYIVQQLDSFLDYQTLAELKSGKSALAEVICDCPICCFSF